MQRGCEHGAKLRATAGRSWPLSPGNLACLPPRVVCVGDILADVVLLENGRTVLAWYFTLPLDTKKEISFSYTVPSAVDTTTNPYVYRLLVQKQPGTRAIPLTVSIQPPHGSRIVSVELDSGNLEGNPSRIVNDLTTDREVVVRYEPHR
jgi:hypothetical protein